MEKTHRKMRRTNRPFKPEEIYTKQGTDSHSEDKIQTFTTEWPTSVAVLLTIDILNLPKLWQTDINIPNQNSALVNISKIFKTLTRDWHDG